MLTPIQKPALQYPLDDTLYSGVFNFRKAPLLFPATNLRAEPFLTILRMQWFYGKLIFFRPCLLNWNFFLEKTYNAAPTNYPITHFEHRFKYWQEETVRFGVMQFPLQDSPKNKPFLKTP